LQAALVLPVAAETLVIRQKNVIFFPMATLGAVVGWLGLFRSRRGVVAVVLGTAAQVRAVRALFHEVARFYRTAARSTAGQGSLEGGGLEHSARQEPVGIIVKCTCMLHAAC
jgi:hypothetical protein